MAASENPLAHTAIVRTRTARARATLPYFFLERYIPSYLREWEAFVAAVRRRRADAGGRGATRARRWSSAWPRGGRCARAGRSASRRSARELRPDHDGPRRGRPLPRADRRARSPMCRRSRSRSAAARPTSPSRRRGSACAPRSSPRSATTRSARTCARRCADFGVDDALGRHAPDAAHAGRLLRDPPARRLPAALLPRAAGAGHDARRRRARPRRDPRGARVLDDRHRAVGRAEPRGDAGRARRARRLRASGAITVHDLDHRPMFWPDESEAGRWAREALAHATVAVGNRDEVAVAVGTRDPHAAAARCSSSASQLAIVKRGPRACSRARGRARRGRRRCALEVVYGLGAGDAFGGALVHGLLARLGPRARRSAGQRGRRATSPRGSRARTRCRPSASSRRWCA